jgi:hypothetical protein
MTSETLVIFMFEASPADVKRFGELCTRTTP